MNSPDSFSRQRSGTSILRGEAVSPVSRSVMVNVQPLNCPIEQLCQNNNTVVRLYFTSATTPYFFKMYLFYLYAAFLPIRGLLILELP